jgi:hypothetical protein
MVASVLIRRPERLGFWWHTRSASETLRETVRLHCAQTWSEYAAVLYLGRQGVTYDVPGRRRDGTRRHRRPFRWVAHVLVVTGDLLLSGILLLPVFLPTLLVFEVLDGVGTVDATSWEFGQPKLAVTGPADSLAVALADQVRGSGRDLWLVWSGTRIAVVTIDVANQPMIAWQAEDAAAHRVRPSSGVIDFADGSTVSFAPSEAELERLGVYADRP